MAYSSDISFESELRKVMAAKAQLTELTRERDLGQQRGQVLYADTGAFTGNVEGGTTVATGAETAQKDVETENESFEWTVTETE